MYLGLAVALATWYNRGFALQGNYLWGKVFFVIAAKKSVTDKRAEICGTTKKKMTKLKVG